MKSEKTIEIGKESDNVRKQILIVELAEVSAQLDGDERSLEQGKMDLSELEKLKTSEYFVRLRSEGYPENNDVVSTIISKIQSESFSFSDPESEVGRAAKYMIRFIERRGKSVVKDPDNLNYGQFKFVCLGVCMWEEDGKISNESDIKRMLKVGCDEKRHCQAKMANDCGYPFDLRRLSAKKGSGMDEDGCVLLRR